MELPQESSGEQFFYMKVDERLQVAFAPPSTSLPHDSSLVGGFGRFVPGFLLQKLGGSEDTVKCRVKLVPAGRKESAAAAQVTKELKRWMASPRCAGAKQVLDMRRTVATIYLALSQQGSTLDLCIK